MRHMIVMTLALIGAMFALQACLVSDENGIENEVVNGVETNIDPTLLAQVKMGTDFGLPFIELTFSDGQNGTFILDTGFDQNIVDANFAKQLGLTIDNPQLIQQPGGEIEMGNVPGFSFHLGDLAVEGLSAQSAPIAQLSSFVGVDIHGILGHTFIDRYVVRLDYADGELLVYAPDKDFELTEYRSVPIREVAGEVLVPFSIQQNGDREYAGEIKLDTGSVFGLGFALNFYEEAALEESTPNYLKISGVGAGGETEDRSFKLDLLNFADTEYRNITGGVTVEADGTERRDNAGTIGAQILARQDLILDYSRDQILLGPEYENPVGMPTDHAGLWVIEAEGARILFQVYPGTPAAEMGLQVGDFVVQLNGEEADSFSLDETMRLFAQEPGEVVTLTYLRGEETQIVDLVLRDLFSN